MSGHCDECGNTQCICALVAADNALESQRVVYEWRLTYDPQDGTGGVKREGFGLDEKGARAAMARYGDSMADLKLWRRPKPEKWEVTE